MKNTDESHCVKGCLGNVLIVFSVLIGLVSCIGLLWFYKPYMDANKENRDLQTHYVVRPEKRGFKDSFDKYVIEFQKLHKENTDCVAWIRFPHMKINYPVMQAADNSYYLSHSFSKKYLGSGCIFMDCSNKNDFTDYNTWIYGHNMRDKSMFGSLNYYSKKEFFEKNPSFYLYYGSYVLKCDIFSCYTVDCSYGSYPISFGDQEDYAQYLNGVKNRGLYDTKVKVSSHNHIISLSTCTSVTKGERRIIHAVIRSKVAIK